MSPDYPMTRTPAWPGLVAHSYNPSTGEAEVGKTPDDASLGYATNGGLA